MDAEAERVTWVKFSIKVMSHKMEVMSHKPEAMSRKPEVTSRRCLKN